MNTIDSFQGSEKEVIIFSCVRSNRQKNLGFLTDYRRINVALTRAKHGMVIVGNGATLNIDPKWRTLLTFLKKDGQYFDNYSEAAAFIQDNNDTDLRSSMSMRLKAAQQQTERLASAHAKANKKVVITEKPSKTVCAVLDTDVELQLTKKSKQSKRECAVDRA